MDLANGSIFLLKKMYKILVPPIAVDAQIQVNKYFSRIHDFLKNQHISTNRQTAKKYNNNG